MKKILLLSCFFLTVTVSFAQQPKIDTNRLTINPDMVVSVNGKPVNVSNTLPVDPKTGLISYSEVINIDSASKDDLYLMAREWFAKSYNSSKEVIQMDDKVGGKIIGKGSMRVTVKTMGMLYEGGYVYYTITLAAKDGKYKYEVSDFYHDGKGTKLSASGGALENEKPACGTFSITKSYWVQIKEQVSVKTPELIASLKSAMKSRYRSVSDNW